jgi:hypothetical protein
VMHAGDHALVGEICSRLQITGGKFLLFDRSAAKQIAIAVVCHPLCTRQVTIKYTASARRFVIRVDMQDDPSNFLPLGAVGLGIKKTPIRHQMLFIVAREHRIIRSCVSDIRIEEWFLHHTHTRTPRRYATLWSQSRPPSWDAGPSFDSRSLNRRPNRPRSLRLPQMIASQETNRNDRS